MLTPPTLRRYRVTIRFADGMFEVGARTGNEDSAYRLALTDARMAHPNGNCYGAVIGWEAVECEGDVARRIWQDEAIELTTTGEEK